MVSLVETIAKSLVSNPDAVTVTETKEDDNKTVIQLKVAQEWPCADSITWQTVSGKLSMNQQRN